MKPVIEVTGISKKYKIGETQPYVTLRDSLSTLFRNPLAVVKESLQTDEFWALKNINFKIMPGEIVSLIGHNGAGKSTLLKVLSRITPPTSGSAILRGRVGSLLEVGTGFQQELSARENIYLYGAILGMKRSEVKAKFDEIVDFAEVEKFIDTPLKRFSSGMFTRLAFAVASHLDSDILLVDEVLAVGDADFQNKSVKKMNEVTNDGKTVILVSHNLGLVSSICDRCLVLNGGKLIADGGVESSIKTYLSLHQTAASVNKKFNITKVLLKNKANQTVHLLPPFEQAKIELQYTSTEEVKLPAFWISILGKSGPLFSASMIADGKQPTSVKGTGIIECIFPSLPLVPGVYTLCVGVDNKNAQESLFYSDNIYSFTISGSMADAGFHSRYAEKWLLYKNAGSVVIPYKWNIAKIK